MGDAHQVGRKGIGIAAHDGLHGTDEVRCRHDGVQAPVRVGTVAALAAEGDLERIDGGRHGTGADGVGTDRYVPDDVDSENGLHFIDGTGLHHGFGTAGGFFGRLEDDLDRTVQVLFLFFQEQGRAEHGRRVEIMAAGVHAARFLRFVRQIRLFLDRQAVDIAPQGNDRAGPVAEAGNQARLQPRVQNGDAGPLQFLPKIGRRLKFLVRKFRMFVKMAEIPFHQRLDFLVTGHVPLPFLVIHSGLRTSAAACGPAGMKKTTVPVQRRWSVVPL